MTDDTSEERFRRHASVQYLTMPVDDVYAIVRHLMDEQRSFLENPHPNHIWPSVQRVVDWLRRDLPPLVRGELNDEVPL